jgi:hypothetical protein
LRVLDAQSLNHISGWFPFDGARRIPSYKLEIDIASGTKEIVQTEEGALLPVKDRSDDVPMIVLSYKSDDDVLDQ